METSFHLAATKNSNNTAKIINDDLVATYYHYALIKCTINLLSYSLTPSLHFPKLRLGMHVVHLVILLDARRRHSVDDGVTTRIHVSDSQADRKQGEEHDNAEPQDDVEDHRVTSIVLLGQVDVSLRE